jgi:RNA polymerase-binding transcription factor DksA
MTKQPRYNDEDLEEFRMLIEQKLQKAKKELRETLDSLATTNSTIAQDKVKSLEDGPIVEEQENLNFLIIRNKKFIQHLEAALVRIKNKAYGICRKTRKLISKERLLRVPHATLSINAKNSRGLSDPEEKGIEE